LHRQNILELDNLVPDYKTQNIFVLPSILKTKIITEKYDDIQTGCWEASATCLWMHKIQWSVEPFAGSLLILWSFLE